MVFVIVVKLFFGQDLPVQIHVFPTGPEVTTLQQCKALIPETELGVIDAKETVSYTKYEVDCIGGN